MYARYKLNEAKFFWDKVEAASINSAEQAFYFSAFFSAFRSITFVLQSQYKRYPGFPAIYDRVLAYLASNDLFGDLKEARNISLKEGAKVPALVTKFSNGETLDTIIYECDPLPFTDDVIRKVTLDVGMRKEWLVPADISDEMRRNIYMSQLWYVVNKFKGASPQVEQQVRLVPDGDSIPLKDLSVLVDGAVTFFNSVIPEFEALQAAS